MDRILLWLWVGDIGKGIHNMWGLMSVFVGVMLIVVVCGIALESFGDTEEDTCGKVLEFCKTKVARACVLGYLAITLVNMLMPSRNTIYVYLAGSTTVEMAREISKSDIARKAYQLLDRKLDEALKEAK